jgi:putative ribosome biogenesis GTPase RsgA
LLPTAEKLSQITAGAKPFGMEQATSAVFGGESSAAYKQQLQDLAQQEQSRFAGQAGVGKGSLSRGISGQI